MIRKRKTSIKRHLKIKSKRNKRTIFNYFKNIAEHKEYLIAKALSTEEGRIALAQAMANVTKAYYF